MKPDNLKVFLLKKFLELANFTIIMMVVMFAFVVTTQALLYPNQDLTSLLFGNVFLPGLFKMAGDIIIKGTIRLFMD
jgi:hypothetical protein